MRIWRNLFWEGNRDLYYFINCLRALAAVLITNSHYTNVYPISIIANGGLLGDILFFAIKKELLYNSSYKGSISMLYITDNFLILSVNSVLAYFI